MKDAGSEQDYARAAVEQFEKFDDERRYLLVNAIDGLEIRGILDVGCGAGQVFLPFLEKTAAFCVGVDLSERLGPQTEYLRIRDDYAGRVGLARARGENLPFGDGSFDLVLCRLAIPYMNNRRAIGEISRVLRPGGRFILKTHALPFYLGMIGERIKTLDPKQVAYPVICLAGGIFHWLTGTQLEKGLWRGKEVFQTEGFLRRELSRVGLRIERKLADTNPKTPSYLIIKD
ncbi:MAG: class I SAM-dependent methyltransferase [Pyrinomonadaceae bacterium]